MIRPKKGFTKRDIAALYEAYIDARKKALPQMLAYFDLREVERFHVVYAYREAYRCKPDAGDSDIRARAYRTEQTTMFQQLKEAYELWKSADTESRRQRIETALECQATAELGDAVKMTANGKTAPRQFSEMNERGRKGFAFKVSRSGVEIFTSNRVAAANLLADINGWKKPQEHNINTLSLSDLRFGFGDDEEEDSEE